MMKRRDFLKRAAVGIGLAELTLSTGSPVFTRVAGQRFSAFDRSTIPHTGTASTRLAIGSGHFYLRKVPQVGIDAFISMVRHGFERGLNFWDMSDNYGSHPYFRECLQSIPRENVVILTKTDAMDAAGARSDLDRFCKEIGAEYLDILLLHGLQAPDWPEKMQPVMDVISEARERSIVRTFGCSCHSLEALNAAADSPWVEVLLSRINHRGVRMDDVPEKVVPVLQRAAKNGKTVIGMKILGMADLINEMDQSLHFVLQQECVHKFTIGFQSIGELDELIQKISEVRLS